MSQILRAVVFMSCLVLAFNSFSQPGKNAKPEIVGQTPDPLTISQNTSIAIQLSNLIVEDEDASPPYPEGFSLEVQNGKDYKVQGTTVTPDPKFAGRLTVRVRVNDGKDKSNDFPFQIEVVALENQPPRIDGQKPLSMKQGETLIIDLRDLRVTDPDNEYPSDFTLNVFPGSNYSVNGNSITPAMNFSGILTVPVSVNDGKAESNRFDLKIDVKKAPNVAPQITGQSPLSINQGESLTVELSHLVVSDPDNEYPNDFTLKVHGGPTYSFNGTTVTPSPDFTGMLIVRVSVNDGQAESKRFDLKIEVKKAPNVAPQITGHSQLSINQGESLTVAFNHLSVTDPDNQYPNGFTLKIYGGPNYTFNATTISPSANFSGTLTVPVSVNDGQAESNKFDLKIDVKKAANVAPQITGQSPLSINQRESLTLEFNHLKVTDPDNQYPNGFTLKIYGGPNYTFNATTITPSANFSGTLTVPVSVNDGQAESNRFDLKIDVKKAVNVAPVITGQQTANVKEDEQFVLKLSHINVTDTDDSPDHFTLKIFPGTNYSVDGFAISPSANFSGLLIVAIRVSDGKSDSEPFDFRLNVEPVNDPATVIGQVELQTPMNTVIEIDISHLKIDDPDNKDMGNFSIKLFSGTNYSVAGQVVVPEVGFTGTLTVPVTVNDGNGPGPEYSLKINVTPVAPNKPPVVTGQKPIAITPNSSIEIQLSHLTVNDEDDKYPFGFSLKLFPGDGYSVSNTTITVNPDVLSGNLTVPVVVNDGEDDSPTFLLKVQVLPVTTKPRIIGQRELTVAEDSTLVLKLSDLVVADADNLRYPDGFVLIVLPGNPAQYSREGNTIRPGRNLNGFIEVGVIVSDGVNASDEFPLIVLVTPVNDPPEFIHGVATPLAFQPGQQPILISETVSITDVDSDNLIMAEIGFLPENFSMKSDILDLPENETSLRVIRNAEGILFLIGPGSLDDYAKALSAIQYYYRLTEDETGEPDEILAGPRRIYMKVFDGQANSLPYEIEIRMQAEVQLDIPNAFTPNGDNNNDTWSVRILNSSNVDNAVIRVYDRRGRLLYEAMGLEKSWDGVVNGQLLPVDTYFYTIDLNLTYMQTSYRGAVTILH